MPSSLTQMKFFRHSSPKYPYDDHNKHPHSLTACSKP
ncbi:hypothetical protein EVA_06873 [gut metagenome]|uniref:Uncharacterized protein n=1 Tax=gut metagenome TaxID=749906 RepID=J9GDQ7_9ZZZZ